MIRSPAPALVVATPLAAGAEVEAGSPVLVLESMKMETVLRAPFKALVKECLVSVGSQVEASEPLLRLEPLTPLVPGFNLWLLPVLHPRPLLLLECDHLP